MAMGVERRASKSIQKKVDAYIEDFKNKMPFFSEAVQWQALKQIECFCNVNEVDVPSCIKLAIEQHEIAAKRAGAFLDGWDGCDLVSYKKHQGVSEGNCMFFQKKFKLRRGGSVKNIECIEGCPDSKS